MLPSRSHIADKPFMSVQEAVEPHFSTTKIPGESNRKAVLYKGDCPSWNSSRRRTKQPVFAVIFSRRIPFIWCILLYIRCINLPWRRSAGREASGKAATNYWRHVPDLHNPVTTTSHH